MMRGASVFCYAEESYFVMKNVSAFDAKSLVLSCGASVFCYARGHFIMQRATKAVTPFFHPPRGYGAASKIMLYHDPANINLLRLQIFIADDEVGPFAG